MKDLTKRIPTPITGLVLGLAALGNLLQLYSPLLRNAIGVIAGILFILVILKIILHPNAVAEDLKNPVICSVFATFPMAGMLLATYLKPYVPTFAFIFWIASILLHIGVMVLFFTRFVLKFILGQVFASWYIVFVGIVVASVTAGAFEMLPLGRVAFWFGFASLLILLVVVTKRYMSKIELMPPTKPLIAIYAAPAALCLAGFVNAKPMESSALLWFLIILSQGLYIFVLTQMPKLLKLPFMPGYSAFTFPFVISALSLKLANGLLAKTNPVPFLGTLVRIEEIIATVLVFYVLYGYLKFIFVTSKNVA